MALRILAGESASDIPVTHVPSQLIFEWPALQRWRISETVLPSDSMVLFRDPSVWEKYSSQVLAVCAVLLLQGAMITGLLYERRRRHDAEVQSRQRMSELAHFNRYSMAGELTATIAHELNQPLGSILVNTETAELMIKSKDPDLHGVGEILADIRRDNQRASDVILRLRSLLKKAPFELKDIDLNEVARETMAFLSAFAIARNVSLTSVIDPAPLPVKGDRIQLQQVIMNLVVNAIDAMSDMPSAERRIVVSTARDGNSADLSVSDAGPGIPAEKLKKVFEPFFSTKSEGMGMGLSIARTIVEAHGGQLSAKNRAGGGAVFSVMLQLAAAA
jgi:signal transduction histidine kinase